MKVYKANGEADFLINSLVEKYKLLKTNSSFRAFQDAKGKNFKKTTPCPALREKRCKNNSNQSGNGTP